MPAQSIQFIVIVARAATLDGRCSHTPLARAHRRCRGRWHRVGVRLQRRLHIRCSRAVAGATPAAAAAARQRQGCHCQHTTNAAMQPAAPATRKWQPPKQPASQPATPATLTHSLTAVPMVCCMLEVPVHRLLEAVLPGGALLPAQLQQLLVAAAGREGLPLAASGGAGDGGGGSSASDSRTPAQRAFDEVQSKRLKEEARKMAAKSHSERVSELNEKLKKAPEHNDLFRISYGGQG